MKYYKLAFYILIFSIILTSCDDNTEDTEKDKVLPVIIMTSPSANNLFRNGEKLILTAEISDNIALNFAEVTFTNPFGETILRKIDLSGTSQFIEEEFTLSFATVGPLKISIMAVDKSGNRKIEERSFKYQGYDIGSIDFNIKLQYNGEPLVMFEDYTYPEGGSIDFTRCSFYTSNMRLDGQMINEVEFHNLTNSHANAELANEGYSWLIEDVKTGNYDKLSFNIGVPNDLNKMDPGEFPSGHPLAKPAENWFSWMSYIFLKVEGNIDLDENGDNETGVAIHTGSDDALRNLVLDYPIQIIEDETTEVDIIFDVYYLFEGTERIYPIAENPQIHSLSQLDAVVELTNNLINTIHK